MKTASPCIITATTTESSEIIRSVENADRLIIQGKVFHRGFWKGEIPIIVCVSGIGKTHAAHAATILIERFSPSIVYVIGIGGAYPSSGLSAGDIVIAESERFGDEGVMTTEGFFTLRDLYREPGRTIHGGRLPMLIPDFCNRIPRGPFVTVSACTGTYARAQEIEKCHAAVCENMEGAAVAEICSLNHVPVAEIRSISNLIGDRGAEPIEGKALLYAAQAAQKFFAGSFGNE